MITFAFANPKGGTGKTTSALLLAEQIAQANVRVTVLDCDPNQNIIDWATRRMEYGYDVPFQVLPRPSEDELINAIDNLVDHTDYLILDLEGTANQMVTFALSRADLVLIPLEPNSVEGPHAARAVTLVKRTGHLLQREIPYALLLNRCNAAFETSEERALRREIAGSDVPILPVALMRRTVFARIFGEASLLSELAEASTSARERHRLEQAIANVQAYTQCVADTLKERLAA